MQAQLDYSSRSSRWRFPSLYYTLNFATPGGQSVKARPLQCLSLFIIFIYFIY